MSDLTPRERRAQHSKAQGRGLPKRALKTYGLWAVALLGLGGIGYAMYSSGGGDCPTHWHSTFMAFVPGPGGAPARVDFASPRAANGAAYYDLSGGAGMGMALHMHQSGAESGSQALGPTQWHFESNGTCMGVKSALHKVEVDATATSLKLTGAHEQVGQDKVWEANATASLHWFVQSKVDGNWTWQERPYADVAGYQLKDGESLLIAFGDYSATQVAAMQAQIPAPISRAS